MQSDLTFPVGQPIVVDRPGSTSTFKEVLTAQVRRRARNEHGYEGDGVTISSTTNSDGIGIDEDSKATIASEIRGNGSVRLFYINESGIFFIFGMTLQNGRSEDGGGGGKYALRESTVVNDNCSWGSL